VYCIEYYWDGTVDKMGSFRITLLQICLAALLESYKMSPLFSHDILASKANKPTLGRFKEVRVRPIETATYINCSGPNPIGGEIFHWLTLKEMF
jgi:hypothetical protein